MANHRIKIGHGLSPTWPFTLPASGAIGTISSNTLNDTVVDATTQFNLNKVLGDWCSPGVVLYKTGGIVTDIAYVIFGAGHDSTYTDNGVYEWRASTGVFTRLLAQETQTPHAVADVTHGEDTTGRPGAQHTYSHVWGLNSDEAQGPAHMQLYGSAIEQGANLSGQAHRFDMGTHTWARYGDVAATQLVPSTVVKDTLREVFVRFPSDALTAYYTLDYTSASPTWQTLAQASRTGSWNGTTRIVVAIYDPVRDIYIGGCHTDSSGFRFRALDASNPSGSWVELTFTGSGPTGITGQGLMHRPIDDTFLLVDCSTNPPTGVYVLTPPATLPFSNAWTWSRRSFTGASTFGNRADNSVDMYNRFQYVEALDSIIVCPTKDYPMEAWRL